MGSFGTVIPVTGLNNGFLGHISRLGKRTVKSRQLLATTTSNLAFGGAAVIVPDATGGTYQPVADFIAGGGSASNMAKQFAGVAVREIKTNLQYGVNVGINTQTVNYYQPGEIAEVLEEGSVVVQINYGTPQSQGAVYVRTVFNASIPNGAVGGFEAQSDGTNNTLIPGVVWTTGVVDSNNCAEITILNRLAA